jgi:heat shock protein HtpX
MWEQIRANKIRSFFLICFMALLLMVLGFSIGEYLQPRGGIAGVLVAMGIWVVFSLLSYYRGADIMLMMSNAREITHDDHPRLFNVVEEMKIAAGLPKIPKIYIIDESAPNAFATGRDPANASVAITAGLLKKLNRDELQGVIAHEMSHVQNRDVLYVTMAGILMGTIVLLSDFFLRGVFYGGGSRHRSSSKGGGQAVFLILAIALAILGPIAAQLLYFALSRRREYLADANGALLTRYPEGLASALEKIAVDTTALSVANRVTAPMYIINPLRKAGLAASNLTSTHPPIDQRIKILRSMAGGASFLDYDNAWRKVAGSSGNLIPAGALRGSSQVAIRKPLPDEAVTENPKQKNRQVNELLHKINNYAFLACACGLKMKVPPDMKEKQLKCPRCGRTNEIPSAELAAIGTLSAALGQKEEKPAGTSDAFRFVRTEKGWTSFKCPCTQTITLSPVFQGDKITCPRCSRAIEIVNS